MKKILGIVLLLGLVFLLTGCECRHPEENALLLDKKEARCDREGFTGNLMCVDCGTIVVPGEVIPATDHTPGERANVVEASCAEAGYTGDVFCTACNALLEQGTAIEALPHTPAETRTGVKEASCAEEGYTGDVLCTVCGGIAEAGAAIEVLPHTPGKAENAVAASCTATGYSGDVYCTVCEAQIEVGKETEMLPHTPGEPVNAAEASCTAAGYTGDVFCAVCEAQIETGTEIEALPHTMDGIACADCGWMAAGLYVDGALAKDWAALLADGEIVLSEGSLTTASPALTGMLVLGDEVKEIGYGAFDGHRGLTKIVLNEGLEKISGRAFRYSAIESMEMPSTLAAIGRDSFVGCEALVKVDMSAVQGDWASLSLHSFGDCLNLEELLLPANLKAISGGWVNLPGLEKLSLPEGLSACAVQSEYIEAMDWPVSLDNAFSVLEGMPNLMTVHYRGSEAQWSQVAGYESIAAAVIFNYAE